MDLIFNEMSDALANDGHVDITAFGKFEIFDRKSRMGINPVTKERMMIQATKLPKFRPSQTLKISATNRSYDLFLSFERIGYEYIYCYIRIHIGNFEQVGLFLFWTF